MRPLTQRQEEVLNLIKSTLHETGMPPTRAEIAKQLGFRSANAAEEHLKALARKGVIEMLPGTSRGIRVHTDHADQPDDSLQGLPLIGRVAAGEPILAQEHVESHYQVDPMLFKPGADYLLRVNGESMKNIGILDGDLLAVHKTSEASNGQVVVARLDDEVTVKRLEKKGNRIVLHAENDDFSPINVDLTIQPFHIEGLAVGIIRNSDWM